MRRIIKQQQSHTYTNLVRAKTLLRISTLLSRAYTKNDVAEIIVNEAFPILGAYNGDVLLFGEEKTFHVIAHKGYPRDFVKQFPVIPQDTPLLTHKVLKTKIPYFISDIKTIDKKYSVARKFIETSGTRASVLLPLLVKEVVVGVVQFTFKEERKFSSEEKIFLNTLATQCSQAFERVMALEDLQASKNQVEIILKNTTEGIIALDKERKIIYVNKTAASLLGYKSPDVLKGLFLSHVLERFEIVDVKNTAIDIIPDFYRKGSKNSKKYELKFVQKKTGKYCWFVVKTSSINDRNGNIAIELLTLHDVTETKEIDQKKDDFINIASHELKTPLTSIILYFELLKRKIEVTDQKTTRYLDTIEEQIFRMQKLIADFLDISQIQQKKLLSTKEDFRLDHFLKRVVSELQLTTPTHTFSLHITPPTIVYADQLRMYQVMNNLLSNAVKYSPLHRQIEISLQHKDGYALVSVKDQGRGIAKEHHKKIFDRFYQITEHKKIGQRSLGMGLYIVKEIIKNHGGNIWVESAFGKGSTFVFAVPLVKKP